MKTFEELDAEYDAKWREELQNLMEQGVPEDEIRKRADFRKESPSLDGLSYFNPHITSISSHISRVASLSK